MGKESSLKERPRVGLALAGGFARGIAHIGVLRALKQGGIPIDVVAGTSVGALIGACYCAGAELNDMQRIGAADKLYRLRALDARPGLDWLPISASSAIWPGLPEKKHSRN